MLTAPATEMLTVLPTAEAGTRHLTEDADTNVITVTNDLESAKSMRHVLVNLSKMGNEDVTVTFTASRRANVGVNTKLVKGCGGGGALDTGEALDTGGALDVGEELDVDGELDAGGALVAGGAEFVAGDGSYSIPN